jgi:hypothetical protein
VWCKSLSSVVGFKNVLRDSDPRTSNLTSERSHTTPEGASFAFIAHFCQQQASQRINNQLGLRSPFEAMARIALGFLLGGAVGRDPNEMRRSMAVTEK